MIIRSTGDQVEYSGRVKTQSFAYAAVVTAVFLLAAPVAASDAPPQDFAALVKRGDQARIAGNWSVALEAYAKALELRDDPLVAGRVGLVLSAFQEYDAAAGKLFHAIERGAGVDDAERTRFFQAFLLAQKHTCRLDVIVVQNGVKLELDNDERFSGRREFWAFVKAGKRKLHATLEGFEDQTIEIDARKGGQLSLRIELRPIKPPEEPAKQPDPPPPTPEPEARPPEVKPAPVMLENNPSALTNPPQKNGSFVVGLGIGFVFGATPTPALGPHAFAAWRSRSWWEVGVDARVAWTFVKDDRSPTTQFVTWSAMLVPCGRWRKPWFACALVQIDGAQRTDGMGAGLLPGFGLRGGVEFETHKRLAVQLLGDVVIHHRGFAFTLPETGTSWTGSLVTGVLAVRGIIKP